MSDILAFVFGLWSTTADFLNTCVFTIGAPGHRPLEVSLLTVMLAMFVIAVVIRAFIPKP